MRSRTRVAGVLILALVVWPAALWAAKDVHAVFEKAKKHLQAGEYDEAVVLFSRLLGLDGLDAKNAGVIRLTRAQAYFKKDEPRKSLEDIHAVLRSGTADGETVASAYRLRGALHLKQDRNTAALEDFTAAIKTMHDNPEVKSLSFADRAMAFMHAGQLDNAVRDLNKAIQLDPASPHAYAVRALVFLHQDKIELARKDSRQAMAMKPEGVTRKILAGVTKELSVDTSKPNKVTVPVTNGGQIYVQVRFSKGGRPHRFVLDTGATSSVIDSTLLAEISKETEVTKVGEGIVGIADGTKHRVIWYRVKSAFLYNLPLGAVEVGTFEKKGVKITNLLGMRSLKNVMVSIDNGKGKVEIIRKEPL